LDHGFSVEDLGIDSVYKLADFLEGELRNQSNTIGFGPSLLYLCHIMNLLTSEAPGILPDADDTAKVIVTMNLLNRPTSCREMINTFDGSSHFRTYANESTPSVSANCNVLIALAQSPDANKYTVEILKALRFLSQLWSRGEMKDKWVILKKVPSLI
jgi:hypothetical protein